MPATTVRAAPMRSATRPASGSARERAGRGREEGQPELAGREPERGLGVGDAGGERGEGDAGEGEDDEDGVAGGDDAGAVEGGGVVHEGLSGRAVESIRSNRFDSVSPMTTDRQPRATLRAVAEAAGVSTSTASLAFSGKGPVGRATPSSACWPLRRDLGYTGPDPLASSLRHGRSGVVGVIVEGRLLHAFRDPFAVSVLDGLSQVLDEMPAGMLLIAQHAGAPEKAIPQLAGTALDAVVFSLCGPDDNPAVDHLAARGIPMVGDGSPADERGRAARARQPGRQRRREPAPEATSATAASPTS